jgi:hypothetical protein
MLPALIAAVSVATTTGAPAPPPRATEAYTFAKQRHTASDGAERLHRGAFARVLRVVWALLRDVS